MKIDGEQTKLAVLLLCCSYLGFIVAMYSLGKPVEVPSWVVSLITMVFIYFFRKGTPNDKKGEI